MRPYAARSTGLALAAAALLLGLTACDKPVPSVSVFSGTTTVREEAVCWSFDASDKVDAKQCLPGDLPTLEVVPGQTIGISVDVAVAERGWYPAIGDSALSGSSLEGNYFRFTLTEQDLADGPLDLRVVALGAGKLDRQATGLWLVRLARA